jgi:hypothetical protein
VAKGAELVAGGFPAHTIYVWPSRELIARSWDWPEAWHAAFGEAAEQLAGLVATPVLGGLSVTGKAVARQLRAGWVSFRVKCSGTRIYIAVLDFKGPHAPGPDGGTRKQLYPADGFVLGLRGSGKSFTIVTFYGPLPPVPVENSIRGPWKSVILLNLQENGSYNLRSSQRPTANIMWMPTRFRTTLPNATLENLCSHRSLASILKLAGGEEANRNCISLALKEPRFIWQRSRGRSLRRKLPSFAGLDPDTTALLSLPLHRPPFDCPLGRGRPPSGNDSMRLH